MDTVPAPVVDPAVVMRLSRRRALEFGAGIAVVFGLWLYLTPAFDPFEVGEPVDYAQSGALLVDVGMVVTVCWVAAAVAAGQRVTLQPAGPRPGVGWHQVTEVAVVSSFLGQAVGLRLSSGRRLRLTLPLGGAWRRDRAFRSEFEWVRAYAIAHGAVLGPVRSRRVRTLLVSLIPLLVIAAAAGALTVWRGAIWPWSPRATAPPACAALAPGLDQMWPAPQRRLLLDDPATCRWESIAGDSPPGPADVAEARVANILVVVHLTRLDDQTGRAPLR